MAPFTAEVSKKYSYDRDEHAEISGGLVGAEKAAREQALHRLTHVFLPGADVTEAGPPGEIASTCGEIEELDLEANPIGDWRPVLDIASQLPKLRWLGLNRLQLAPLSTLPSDFGSAVGRVRSLCLGRTAMEWDQLLLLVSAMPELSSLHFGANGVTSLAPSDTSVSLAERLSKLTVLWVEDNKISSWDSVAPLSELPALEVLNLNGNQISSLPNPLTGFGLLKQIMLRGNPIEGWESITALDSLPSLRDTALRDIPLISKMSASSQRRSIIALLSGLKMLNGSEVGKRERERAERYYLRAISEQYPEGGLPSDAVPEQVPGGSIPDPDQLAALINKLRIPDTAEWRALEKEHPRWRALLCLHGEQRKTAVTSSSSGVISAELIELTIRSTAADAGHLPPITRRLPNGLPVKSIKAMAGAIFKVSLPVAMLPPSHSLTDEAHLGPGGSESFEADRWHLVCRWSLRGRCCCILAHRLTKTIFLRFSTTT